MISTYGWIRRKVRSLLIRALNKIDNNDNADFAVNGEGLFAERLLDRFRGRDVSPVVVFDVGANAGHYSQMLLDGARDRKVAIELHAFEPAAKCVEALRLRFASDPRVHVVPAAASAANQSASLYFDEPGSGLASMYRRDLSAYSMELGRSETIQTIRLDQYIDDHGVQHIHFLKLDVEGHEVAVLEGLGRYLDPEFTDFVQFEYGGANLDSNTTLRQLFAAFTSKGYRVGKIMRNGLDLRDYEVWMDNYQYSNYVAVSGRIAGALS